MLESIRVKNLALIKESEIELGSGLNILTGETGAGKSIILGSVRLALGERARTDMVRNGEETALVELVFLTESEEINLILEEYDIPCDPDGTVIITRKLQAGRSVARCNGETVSAKGLKRIASCLINIHGQNDTQALLDDSNYMDILDEYGEAELEELKEAMSNAYKEYATLKNELDRENKGADSKDRDLALARYELEEIENARLVAGEDEELEERYQFMVHARKIQECINNAYELLAGDRAAADNIGLAMREVGSATQFTDSLGDVNDMLVTIDELISDCSRSLKVHLDECDFSEQEYHDTEDRLNIYNKLKDKYGGTVEKVLAYAEAKQTYITKMEDYDAYIAELKGKTDKAHKHALSIANKLSEARSKVASELQNRMTDNLKELNFLNVVYDIAIDKDESLLSESGIDAVDFLVSFNLGEPVKSLGQVASGGELSRFMLALKAVTADRDSVDTLIFDEIDSGISGKTAWSVAEKMATLSKKHQVIAITHLPQIGAMADRHYLISKEAIEDTTVTDIAKLTKDASIGELARLLSAGDVTDANIVNARELVERAEEYKSNL